VEQMFNIQYKSVHIFIIIIFFLTCILRSVYGQEIIPAFPAAEGFGTETVGGRGGQVIEVTNLNDNGRGSLREAIETEGPRIVVFRVGGMIELQSGLLITHPYITIAGQTAPGDGITLKGYGENRIEATHDVIIRYLRFRGIGRENQDCLNILHGSYNVVIDHCSFSWGTDETISIIAKSHDVTVQWCIMSEGLDYNGKGSLVSTGAYNVSLHHNLYAHNGERNAKMKGNTAELDGHLAYYDYVNNVVYNWYGYAHSVAGCGKGNVIGNYFKPGINSGSYPERREIIRQQWEAGRQIYARDNIGATCPQGCESDWDGETFLWNGVEYEGGMISDMSGDLNPNGFGTRTDTPIPTPPVSTLPATLAFEKVLANSGAIFPFRDAVDERIVNDVKNGSGNIIMDPSEVGGWPVLNSGIPPTDTDHDGMPDDWETAIGLDINDPSDGLLDMDEDGYTNVEEYINGLLLLSDDIVPPNPPGNLYLESRTESFISFAWTAPEPTSDGDLAEFYVIKRDNVIIGSTKETRFTDSGLTKNTTYNYKVYSFDDDGNRNNSPAVADFTTTDDQTPPQVSSARGLSLNSIEVVFNEAIEKESAENINNYSINNGISINGASLQNDTRTVHLSTTLHTEGQSYSLTINNIFDRAPAPNMIAANTAVSYTAADLLPPNPPVNLVLESRTDATISLAWTAPEPASDGDVAVSYSIMRNGVAVGPTSEIRFSDSGLIKNTTYNYQVYSYDSRGNRSNSPATGDFTTTDDQTPPGVSSVQGLSFNRIEVIFNEAVEKESAENINNYSINNGISINSAYLQNDTRTVHLSTTLHTEGQSYSLTINNIVDRASAQNKITTNIIIPYTAADSWPPNPPEYLVLDSRTETSITLKWTAPGLASDGDLAVSYRIKRNNDTIGQTTETQFTDSGLTKNTTYTYRVYSYDIRDNRSNSAAIADFTTAEDITPPQVSSVRGLSLKTIEVMFSEEVEMESAENIDNYSIDGITITHAYLQNDNQTVHLRTTAHTEGQSYTLIINNILDRSPTSNMIAPDTKISYIAVDNLLVIISVDNEYEIHINGNKMGDGNNWSDAESYVFPLHFEKIVIAVKGIDLGGEAGLVACVEMNGKVLVSNETWNVTKTFQPFWTTNNFVDDSWSTATSYGELGDPNAMPWAGMPNGGVVHGLLNDKGAKWIWTDDYVNDDVAYFRYVIYLSDIIPPSPPQGVTVKIP